MKNLKKSIIFTLILVALVGSTACSASKKSNCGCPNKKGMVGY